MSTPPTTPSIHDAWWRRLQAAAVARPELTRHLDRWSTQGGRICLVGPRGSGRTRLLGSVVRGLEHARQPHLIFTPGRLAGETVRRLLITLGLEPEVPLFPDATRRARHAAARIVRGWRTVHGDSPLTLVVDDVHLIDPLTRSVLAALLREPGVKGVATATTPVDGLETVSIPTLDRDQVLRLDPGAKGPITRVHIGAALQQRVPGASFQTVAGAWSSLSVIEGLSAEAAQLLQLLSVAVVPVPRVRAGRLLGLDLAALTRACRALLNRGVVVEWSGGLRLASPTDAHAIEQHFGHDAGVHQRAATLLPADHPGRVPHAVASPPTDVRELVPSLRALLQWDPARATRWGRSLLAHRPSPILARFTADAALACRRRDIAVRVVQETAARVPDVLPRVALFSLAGLIHLEAPADVSAARGALRHARAACGGMMHPPAEMCLLEARLRHVSEGGTIALAQLRAARDNPSVFADTLAAAREVEAEVFAGMGRLDDAVPVWNELLGDDDLPRRERVAGRMAAHFQKAQRPLDASDAMVRLAHADRSIPDPLQAKALDKAAHLALSGGDPGAAIAHWTASLELSRALHARSLVGRVRPRLAAALREVCRYDEALEVAQAALDDRTTTTPLRVECSLIAADVGLARGRLDAVERWLTRATKAAGDSAKPVLRVRIERRLCAVAALRGDPRALDRVTTAARAAHRCQATRDLSRLHAIRAYLLARARRTDEVGPSIDRAEAPLRDAGAGRLLAEVRIWAARAWLAVGELDGARAAAANALVWAEETGHLRLRDDARGLLDSARQRRGAPSERYDRLLEISTSLASERTPERIFQRTVSACAELLRADRAFCVLVDGETDKVAAAWRGDGRPAGTPSRSVIRAALGHGREIAVGDVEERAELRAQESIVAKRVRSVMCVPMFDTTVDGARILGVLYVDSPARSRDEVDRGLRTLRALAALTATALAGARTIAEAELRTRRAKEMAHDLRSPAAALQMAGEELAEGSDVPLWARDAGRLIASQAQRILDTGERYLSDRGTEPGVFSLGALAIEVGRVVGPLARASGRSVLVDVVSPVEVDAAADDIQRVLFNLIQNGLRHTPPGSAVEVRVDRRADGIASCQVIDAGEGVSADILPHIFDRGVRGDGSGHGLGLSIARRLGRTWGGELEVENLDRHGACFTLTLPEAARDCQAASV